MLDDSRCLIFKKTEIKNASKINKKVPGWAPSRSDMPVISPNQVGDAAKLMNKGQVNWKEPFEKKASLELLKIARLLTGGRYPIHHRSFTSAAGAARELAEKSGFEIDEEDWFMDVTTGPRKPGAGKTNSYRIPLMKNGEPVRKMLVFQVYGMEKTRGVHSGTYELTAYIS